MKFFRLPILAFMLCACFSVGAKEIITVSFAGPGLKFSWVETEFKKAFERAGFTVMPAGYRGAAAFRVIAGTLTDPGMRTQFDAACKGSKITADGFFIIIKDSTVYIGGKEDRSLLYGAYDFLTRFCGYQIPVRPIDSGTPGQFKGSILENQAYVSNPAFPLRGIAGYLYRGPKEDFLHWLIENRFNYFPLSMYNREEEQKQVFSKGLMSFLSGHSFCSWLPGTLYKTHPEYFPLIKGKRIPYPKPDYAVGVQINVGNPEVVDLVAENIKKYFKTHPGVEMVPLIMNDGHGWGDSPEERKLDDPDEYRRGVYSTRYFRFVNMVAEKVCREYPKAKIMTFIYLSVEEPPKIAKLHPNLVLGLCTYRRCYKYQIDDPASAVNQRWNNLLKAWLKFGNPVFIYDYLLLGGMPSFPTPFLKVLQHDLQYYRKLGVMGYYTESVVDGLEHGTPPDIRKKYYRSKPEDHFLYWTGMKMNYHLLGQLLWDPTQNLEKLEENYFKSYFGPAGTALLEIYQRIEKRWEEDKSPYIWNQYDTNFPAMLFRRDDAAFISDRLNTALTAAKKSGKQQYIERVRREKLLIEKDWFKRLQSTRKVLDVKPFNGKISIATVKAAATRNGSLIDGFKVRTPKGPAPAAASSKIYAVTSGNNLILLSEFSQPREKVQTTKVPRDGQVWRDNDTFEIFINAGPEKMSDGYYQFVTNASGSLYDAQLRNAAWNCGAQVTAEISADAWRVMISIPLKELGYPEIPAELGINFGRSQYNPFEISSWTDGSFANQTAFGRLRFKPEERPEK